MLTVWRRRLSHIGWNFAQWGLSAPDKRPEPDESTSESSSELEKQGQQFHCLGKGFGS